MDDPHVQARGTFVDVPQESGATVGLDAPVAHMSRTPLRLTRAAPAVGEDSDQILQEIGLTPDEIAALKKADVV